MTSHDQQLVGATVKTDTKNESALKGTLISS